ncbi:hypothetical protein SAMN05421690_100747 [Nitrosomonas sp. Nm51]|nr:hypothetical protein SAMN05421690_100747 [Nitrosomonas sp. Nm51]
MGGRFEEDCPLLQAPVSSVALEVVTLSVIGFGQAATATGYYVNSCLTVFLVASSHKTN